MKARRISIIFTIAWLGQATAQKWPTTISPPPKLGNHRVLKTGKGFLYETTNYRVETLQEIDGTLMMNFATSAESVALALKAIPLPLYSQPNEKRALIKIAPDEESYFSAGGAVKTAGFYNGRTQSVIIRWDQLNRTPSDSDLLERPAFDLLVHELCHLCMHPWMGKMEAWLTEGVAEYLAAAHLVEGRFDFRKIDHQIRDHIRNRIPSQEQQTIVLKIETLIGLSSKDWLKRTATLPPAEALQSYSTALLLTHYFFHGGAERRQEIAHYLDKLAEVKFRHEEKPVILTKTEASKIETRLTKYWDSRGLKLVFK